MPIDGLVTLPPAGITARGARRGIPLVDPAQGGTGGGPPVRQSL